MRIFAAHFYHESNTFCADKTYQADFEFFQGQQVVETMNGCQELLSLGAEVVPGCYAARWSSGTVDEQAFLFYEGIILRELQKTKDTIDGILLSLHGGMTVENIGSGEYRLLTDIRRIVGPELPVSVSLDMHANLQQGIEDFTNIICGYHTAPHTDAEETERKAARLLVDYLRSGEKTHPAMARAPMLLIGERAITSAEPLYSLMQRCKALETDERIFSATIFVSMAWGDTPNTCVSVVVTPRAERHRGYALEQAQLLADELYRRREECDYAHPTYEMDEAIKRALESEQNPVFLCDSGDNPTAGGDGNNTVLLRQMLASDLAGKRVLFAPIFDENLVNRLRNAEPGTILDCEIGMNADSNSAPVDLKAQVLSHSTICAWHGNNYDKVANAVLLRAGEIDILVCDHQLSMTGPECFETAGISTEEYHIVVIKMGYVFPEIRPLCREMIMALSPGRTPLSITSEQYHQLPRPIWPLDEGGNER